MDKRQKNVHEVSDFVSALRLPKDDWGNVTVLAAVIFSSNNRQATEDLRVKFIRNGYQDGDIEMYGGHEITAESFHLGFDASFQSYRFNTKLSQIEVRGMSPKMGGDYTVSIQPILDQSDC